MSKELCYIIRVYDYKEYLSNRDRKNNSVHEIMYVMSNKDFTGNTMEIPLLRLMVINFMAIEFKQRPME